MLLNGDCLELMKTLPDKSIDLFICDLPYGCLGKGAGALRHTNGVYGIKISWDVKINLDKFWEQVERLMKDDYTPIIHFCNTRFGYDLIKSKEKWFRYDLVWNKEAGVGFFNANKQPLRSHELVYVFAKKRAKYNRIVNSKSRCIKSVIEVSNIRIKGQHPTTKPVELYKFLIERYSNEGDMVLDPTFGSGNSGIATTELNRKYIGIEKDDNFFKTFQTKISIAPTPP